MAQAIDVAAQALPEMDGNPGPRPETVLARQEISEHVLKLLVGFIAFTLAPVVLLLGGFSLPSISASYHNGWAAQEAFVGMLFAISAFLCAYNGHTYRQMLCSKIAAVAGICIALFPCECVGERCGVSYPVVHYIAAGTMFGVLAYFCWVFWKRAEQKLVRNKEEEAKIRISIYKACFALIVISMGILAADAVGGKFLSRTLFPNLTLWMEAISLFAFGVSWLISSRMIMFTTDERQRIEFKLPPMVQRPT